MCLLVTCITYRPLATERDGPMTTAGFRKMLTRCSKQSGLEFSVHPHMLRHACGYKLANDRRDT
ncbi:MAG: tyrosine-type recombinase/integrase [Pseudomonadota bacterium]|nr:tyrosine-type recombinase/integrase [Pseudomonadota bacterium]